MFKLLFLLLFTTFSFASIEDAKTEATGIKAPCEHCGVNVAEVQLEENTNCDNHLLPSNSRCGGASSKDKAPDKGKTSGVR